MKKLKILISILIILSIFGIFFLSITAHELYHSITMKGAEAICFPTNLKISDSVQNGYLFAYTQFNFSEYGGVKEYDSIRETSEKYAGIIGNIFGILIALGVGYLAGSISDE